MGSSRIESFARPFFSPTAGFTKTFRNFRKRPSVTNVLANGAGIDASDLMAGLAKVILHMIIGYMTGLVFISIGDFGVPACQLTLHLRDEPWFLVLGISCSNQQLTAGR